MGEERYGKKPEAAGVLYHPANYPLFRGTGEESDEQVAKENAKAVLRKGVLLDKPELYGDEKKYLPISFDKEGNLKGKSIISKEVFEKVSTRLTELIDNMGSELSCGSIDANPYADGDGTSCDFCKMKSICRFDEREGDALRELIDVRLEDC